MKKLFVFVLVILFCIIVVSEEINGEITEEITVTNVDVPVRVMYQGKPVTDLKKSDFLLFENGVEQKINGFFQIKKKIKSQDISLQSERTEDFKSRYFVFAFRIYKNTDELENAINYLVNKTLHKNDKLLLFVNNKTLYFDNIFNKNEIKSIIKKNIKSESKKASQRFEKAFQKISSDLRTARFLSSLEDAKLTPPQAKRFLENYQMKLREYRRLFLTPDMKIYYNLAKHLENISLEKWVITFYQFEKFPVIKLSGRLRRELGDKLNKIDREVKMVNDFPSEEIAKIFYKVNTTFHSLFFSTYKDLNSRDLEFGEISTDLENSFREITKKTGGELIVSNKLEVSIKKIEQSVDSYYMLTYSPTNDSKIGKIDVRVKGNNYKAFFDDNIRADYINDYIKKREREITEVRFKKISFKDKRLHLDITGVMMRKIGKILKGQIMLQISIRNDIGENIFNKTKMLNTRKDELNIKISMNWLKKGTYNLILEIVDLFTYKTIFNYRKIEVK